MKLLRHRANGRLAAIVAAGFAAGCLGSSPNVSLFTMRATAVSPEASASNGLAIGVGPIRMPRYLDRPEWVTRPGGTDSELEVDDYRQWAGGFASNVLSVLSENLGAELHTQRVVVYPAPSPFALDYRVGVDFHAFEAVGGEALLLRATWVIRGSKAEGGPWTGQFTIRRAIAGGGTESFVAAHNEALDLLAGAIASRIENLAKAKAAVDESGGAPSN